MKKLLTRASTLYLVSKGKTLIGDILDGRIEIEKRPSGLYAIKLYDYSKPQLSAYKCNYANFMKFMNRYHDILFYEQEI